MGELTKELEFLLSVMVLSVIVPCDFLRACTEFLLDSVPVLSHLSGSVDFSDSSFPIL
jgi:hypothetical protein